MRRRGRRSDARTAFAFHDYPVTINHDGVVEVSTVGLGGIGERTDDRTAGGGATDRQVGEATEATGSRGDSGSLDRETTRND